MKSPLILIAFVCALAPSVWAEDKAPAPAKPIPAELAGYYHPDFRETFLYYAKVYKADDPNPDPDNKGMGWLNPAIVWDIFKLQYQSLVIRPDGSLAQVEGFHSEQIGALQNHFKTKEPLTVGVTAALPASIDEGAGKAAMDRSIREHPDRFRRIDWPERKVGGGFGFFPKKLAIIPVGFSGKVYAQHADVVEWEKPIDEFLEVSRVSRRIWKLGDGLILVQRASAHPNSLDFPVVFKKTEKLTGPPNPYDEFGKKWPHEYAFDPLGEGDGRFLSGENRRTVGREKGGFLGLDHEMVSDQVEYVPGFRPWDGSTQLPEELFKAGGLLEPLQEP